MITIKFRQNYKDVKKLKSRKKYKKKEKVVK